MKKLRIMVMALLLMCLCSGCTDYAEEYSKNTLIVKGNGSLIEVAVEDYKDTKIKAEDLAGYVEEQIRTYNDENGRGAVKQKKLLTDDMSKVKLVLKYKNIESYNGFNALDCVLTDYSEVDKDYLSGSFTDGNGKSVKKDQFENVEKAKVLVISEPIDIVVNKDILYYNKQVSVENGVITTTGKSNAVIIYK